MDSIILEYINKRMNIRGYEDFQLASYSFKSNGVKAEYRIPAYNEFYFLVSKSISSGTIIHSDTNAYKADDNYALQNYQIQEFSGMIIIENPERTTQVYEFLRAIPK